MPAADMRKGYDGLCGLVHTMGKTLSKESIFIFCNRRRNQIKLLHFEGDGLSIYSKRLERGNFELPTLQNCHTHYNINAQQLHLILSGIALHSVKRKLRYRGMI